MSAGTTAHLITAHTRAHIILFFISLFQNIVFTRSKNARIFSRPLQTTASTPNAMLVTGGKRRATTVPADASDHSKMAKAQRDQAYLSVASKLNPSHLLKVGANKVCIYNKCGVETYNKKRKKKSYIF